MYVDSGARPRISATVTAPTIKSRAQNSTPKEGFEIKDHAKQKLHMGADDPRIARAIFTLRDLAGYLDVPKSNIQRWARPPDPKHPLITCLPAHGREATVPFIGFVEAFVLSSFRRAGLPLQWIRRAVEVLAKEIGLEHALASKRLYTDGAEVLFEHANKHGERKAMELVVVRTQQAPVLLDRQGLPEAHSLRGRRLGGFGAAADLRQCRGDRRSEGRVRPPASRPRWRSRRGSRRPIPGRRLDGGDRNGLQRPSQ